MTHDESERVAVTEADREAAAHLHDCIFGHEDAEASEGYKRLLSGERDDEFMVQTIASHRVEHGRSEEAVKWREALDWAIAEIEGRTRYDKPEQFERCLRLANEALSTRPTPADPAVERLREALQRISGMCPVTQEFSVAHQMAEEAEAALTTQQPPTHPEPARVSREAERRAQLIRLIREQLASTDYPVSQFEREFADAILALRAPTMTSFSDEQIKTLVDRFLSWPLPDDFHPDAGISFNPDYNGGTIRHKPVGTNLLTATQAEQMLRHVLLPNPGETEAGEVRALREALNPFAEWGAYVSEGGYGEIGDEAVMYGSIKPTGETIRITAGDLRRAYAALDRGQSGEER